MPAREVERERSADAEHSDTQKVASLAPRSGVRSIADRELSTRLRHDLRSSVHTVLGFTNLLGAESHGPLTAEQRGFLEHVRDAAHDLERLVDLCLELSPSTQLRPQLERHGLSMLLGRVERRMRQLGIACDIDTTVRAVELELDGERFERALTELGRLVARGRPGCSVRVRASEGSVTLAVTARDAQSAAELAPLERHGRALSNRAVLTLRYAEAMLAPCSLRVDAETTWAELTLPTAR